MNVIKELQVADPEKFTTLCRMHLTFALDLNNEEFSALIEVKDDSKIKKSLNYFGRKHKAKSAMDGSPLLHGVQQVYQLIEYLGRDFNICQEGLFRKTGSLTRQHELRTLLNIGASIDLDSGHYSVHDCASVVKNFLADLPEPLLTEAHYSAHCQISEMNKDCMSTSQKKQTYLRQLKSVQLLFLLLPLENFNLLKDLLLLLHRVTAARKKNRMDACSLATLFAPHIMCPRKMTAEVFKNKIFSIVKSVTFMIEHAPKLFEPPLELVQDAVICLKDVSSLQSVKIAKKEPEAVKTLVAFCDRTKTVDCGAINYTNKALSELQTYIQSLPDSARKRKLVKKFKQESYSENSGTGKRKHVRSRSVGDVLRKHLKWSSHKEEATSQEVYNDTNFYKVLSENVSESSDFHQPFTKDNSLQQNTSYQKAINALGFRREAINAEKCSSEACRISNLKKIAPIGKSMLRASRKTKNRQVDKCSYNSTQL